MSKLKELNQKLGYNFKNLTLLQQALTHCSAATRMNYERYEFLGDAILNFVISDTLFNLFPKENEGQLTQLRAFLVKGEMLVEIAMEIGLGNYLFLGQGELKAGGLNRSSILADAMEAVIAAVFIDGGFVSCKTLILKLYHSRLDESMLLSNLKDPKTQLQEYLQARKQLLPTYSLIKVTGADHNKMFTITCNVGVDKMGIGGGSTRRKAEQDAAFNLLQRLKKRGKK